MKLVIRIFAVFLSVCVMLAAWNHSQKQAERFQRLTETNTVNPPYKKAVHIGRTTVPNPNDEFLLVWDWKNIKINRFKTGKNPTRSVNVKEPVQ